MLPLFVREYASDRRSKGKSLMPVFVSVVLVAAAAIFFYFASNGGRKAGTRGSEPGTELSPATLSVLRQLQAPLEIRFYSVLDPKSAGELNSFSDEARQLLAAYEAAGNGKVTVKSVDPQDPSSPDAAVKEGVRPFNLEKGEAAFLGIAIESNGQKEVLSRLSPEFSAALEADITRAIARLNERLRVAPGMDVPKPTDPAVIESVKAALPDVANTSFEDGTRALQESMLLNLHTVGDENKARLEQAQAAIQKAEQNGSASEVEAARKNLSQIAAENNDRIQQVLSRSADQLKAWQELKSGK